MIWLFKNANYPFMAWRKYAYALSLLLTVIPIASIVLHGGLRYSIDFTGGTLVQLEFDQPVETEVLRAVLRDTPGLESFEVQRFGEPRDVVVRAHVPEGEEELFGQRIEEQLLGAPELEGHEFSVVRTEAVGPKIGEELKQQALMAVLYALILILIYVAIRFDLKFGVAAIVATLHDIVVSVGVFSLLDKEISLAVVAAFLTIVGYSLNDTIVVFDRIREDLRSMRKESYEEVVNRALNQTLSRTIITGGTTLIVLTFLFFMGGEVIHDFAFALIVGILIGTYSSIFIASPVVVEWKHRIEDKKKPAAAPRARSRA
ncbi:MAG TPA: protein translocase subunit SecF [Gemmatimonadota bacterium]|nr:protein translocase subunit SecF [Gemmatimonadota bacterium]